MKRKKIIGVGSRWLGFLEGKGIDGLTNYTLPFIFFTLFLNDFFSILSFPPPLPPFSIPPPRSTLYLLLFFSPSQKPPNPLLHNPKFLSFLFFLSRYLCAGSGRKVGGLVRKGRVMVDLILRGNGDL